MSLERKCENCRNDETNSCDNCYNFNFFKPREYESKEELIRQDERRKFITLLKSDLENFEGLADEYVERKDIHELLQNNAVRKYIEETIALLEKEA